MAGAFGVTPNMLNFFISVGAPPSFMQEQASAIKTWHFADSSNTFYLPSALLHSLSRATKTLSKGAPEPPFMVQTTPGEAICLYFLMETRIPCLSLWFRLSDSGKRGILQEFQFLRMYLFHLCSSSPPPPSI